VFHIARRSTSRRDVRVCMHARSYASLVPSGPGRWNHLDSLEIGLNHSFVRTVGRLFPGGEKKEHPAASPRDDRAAAGDGGGGGGTATEGGGAAAAQYDDDPTGMTEAQERAVFSLFVVVKSPLFIGASTVDLQGHSLATLTNKEVIAVHQVRRSCLCVCSCVRVCACARAACACARVRAACACVYVTRREARGSNSDNAHDDRRRNDQRPATLPCACFRRLDANHRTHWARAAARLQPRRLPTPPGARAGRRGACATRTAAPPWSCSTATLPRRRAP
jgi:hypothetical protein